MDCLAPGEREEERERVWIWGMSGMKGDEGLALFPAKI